LEWKTLWNNALLGWSIVEPNQSLSREAVASRAEQLFNSFGITDQMHKYPSQCSGGQRQRAALIRALLTPVNILALDEPGGAIDHIARVKIYEALLQVVQEGACASGNVAALIVSHDPEELLLLCDRVLVIPGQCATTMTSVPITFARPRDKEIRFKPEFSELKRKLWNCLL
jgi:ABC-type nitrate/sulfonate/bicarbonate transport system ATPase subunit